jgi:hypothetical protein
VLNNAEFKFDCGVVMFEVTIFDILFAPTLSSTPPPIVYRTVNVVFDGAFP